MATAEILEQLHNGGPILFREHIGSAVRRAQ
jgi:hypothetical protein